MKTPLLLAALLATALPAQAGDDRPQPPPRPAGEAADAVQSQVLDVRDLLEVDAEVIDVLRERSRKAGLEMATVGRGMVQLTGTAEQIRPFVAWLGERRAKKLRQVEGGAAGAAAERLRASQDEMATLLAALQRHMDEVRRARAEAEQAGKEDKAEALEKQLHEMELKAIELKKRAADLDEAAAGLEHQRAARDVQEAKWAEIEALRRAAQQRAAEAQAVKEALRAKEEAVEAQRESLERGVTWLRGRARQGEAPEELGADQRRVLETRRKLLGHILPYLRELGDHEQAHRTEVQIREIEMALHDAREGSDGPDRQDGLRAEIRALRAEVRELKELLLKVLKAR